MGAEFRFRDVREQQRLRPEVEVAGKENSRLAQITAQDDGLAVARNARVRHRALAGRIEITQRRSAIMLLFKWTQHAN